jgi:hypothetical protein
MACARRGDHNDVRFDRGHDIVAQPQSLNDTGGEILDHDVRDGDEALASPSPLWFGNVERGRQF